jgi:hypothetical protein
MEVSMGNKKFLAAVMVIALALMGVPAFAQVQSVDDIEAPAPQFQDHGGVTPWFWIGLQTVFSGGYNFETTAGGFRNYGGPDHTYASFNLAFVDSHYQTPKFYEVPRQLDPDAWTGHFILINFTSRLNSWSGDTRIENNVPAWLAEITGKGARIGFFTQAGSLVGGLDDATRNQAANSDPIMKISGGNKVLNLESGQLGKLYYEKGTDSNVTTTYSTATGNPGPTQGAIMYAGYEKKELWNVYLTMLSEGNVNSDVTDDKYKGFAGVIDFGVTPFGVITDEEKPLTFSVTGNTIAGFNFSSNENVGFGLKGGSGIWLGRDNLVLSPVVAFDGKIDVNNEFFWKFGGGLIFQFSGMRWANDDWGDMYNTGGTGSTSESSLADYRYENNKVLKYAYAQAYAAYSEASDLNMLLRVEEPDGNLGFHDKLGFMAELRLNNLTERNQVTEKDKFSQSWESQARVSWDLNISQFSITPYLRGYLNNDKVFKMRLGAYANFIPFTGFELAYTSANLNPNADLDPNISSNRPMSHYESIKDAGRIELIVILKSDDIRPQVPKRMSDWNYPSVINKY